MNLSNVMLVMYAAIFGVALIISLAIHFVQAYGLSLMARACGLKRPWLSWIPLVNNYTIGEIAKCNAVKQRKKPLAYDKILLILNIAANVVGFVMIALMMVLMFTLIEGLPEDYYTSDFIMSPTIGEANEGTVMISMLGFILFYFLYFAVGIAIPFSGMLPCGRSSSCMTKRTPCCTWC